MNKFVKSNDKEWPSIKFKTWRLWDTGICWPEIEPNKNEWHFERVDKAVAYAEKNNIEILITLGLTPKWAARRPLDNFMYSENLTASEPKNIEDWKNYVRTVGKRYKGKIKYWEIWNEPDIFLFYTGTPKQMVELTKEAYLILKAIDPENKIVSPSLTGYPFLFPWLQGFFNNGGNNYVDIIGTHFYLWNLSDTPEKSIIKLVKLNQFLKKNKINKPVWDTECGYIQNNVKNKDLQIAYIPRLAIMQLFNNIERSYFYSLDNKYIINMLNDGNYSQLNNVGIAFQETANWLIGSEIISLKKDSNDIWKAELIRNNSKALMIWHSKDNKSELKIDYTLSKEFSSIKKLKRMDNTFDDISNDRIVKIGVIPVLIYENDFFIIK